MKMKKALVWLHVSDLHFGHGRSATVRFEQQNVVDALVRDARRLRVHIGRPDFIVLTGDVAFSGDSRREYGAAARWLAKLCDAVALSPRQVLVVPGNHDVDRRKATVAVHQRLRKYPNELDDRLERKGGLFALWPKLRSFATFAAGHGCAIDPSAPYWIRRLRHPLRVVAVGLNTVLLSCDDSDAPANLALGQRQIRATIDQHADDRLLVVLQHHPPDWLRDGSELLGHLQGHPHILFCGHVHKQGGLVQQPLEAGHGVLRLVAGAGHEAAKEEGHYSYAWGRLDANGLHYYPRIWLKPLNDYCDALLASPYEAYRQGIGKFVCCKREDLPQPLQRWLASGTLASGLGRRCRVGLLAVDILECRRLVRRYGRRAKRVLGLYQRHVEATVRSYGGEQIGEWQGDLGFFGFRGRHRQTSAALAGISALDELRLFSLDSSRNALDEPLLTRLAATVGEIQIDRPLGNGASLAASGLHGLLKAAVPDSFWITGALYWSMREEVQSIFSYVKQLGGDEVYVCDRGLSRRSPTTADLARRDRENEEIFRGLVQR